VSGIGGKREGAETYMETAIRETVEELFGVSQVPLALIHRIITTVKAISVKQMGPYVMVVYNFNDLEKVLEIVGRYLKKCPLYNKIPKRLMPLILERKIPVTPRPELFYLAILPIVKNASVDVEFLEDIETIQFTSSGCLSEGGT
jgi:hypothetical protein